MNSTSNKLLNINGINYDVSQIAPEGQRLVSLLSKAQEELTRLDIQKELLLASQQQILSLLKPLLPNPIDKPKELRATVLGSASETIPTTPVKEPSETPASFPKNLPDELRAHT